MVQLTHLAEGVEAAAPAEEAADGAEANNVAALPQPDSLPHHSAGQPDTVGGSPAGEAEPAPGIGAGSSAASGMGPGAVPAQQSEAAGDAAAAGEEAEQLDDEDQHPRCPAITTLAISPNG